MARNNPVAIWIIKQRPSSDPKFQRTEMLAGVGRSTTAPFAILKRGWFLRRGIDIMIIVGVLRKKI